MALGTTWSAYLLLREENERLNLELAQGKYRDGFAPCGYCSHFGASLLKENERLRAELVERNESPGVNVRLRHTEILMLPKETRSRLLGEWTEAAEKAGLYGSGDKAETEHQPAGAE